VALASMVSLVGVDSARHASPGSGKNGAEIILHLRRMAAGLVRTRMAEESRGRGRRQVYWTCSGDAAQCSEWCVRCVCASRSRSNVAQRYWVSKVSLA